MGKKERHVRKGNRKKEQTVLSAKTQPLPRHPLDTAQTNALQEKKIHLKKETKRRETPFRESGETER